jgi:hypothetical protein
MSKKQRTKQQVTLTTKATRSSSSSSSSSDITGNHTPNVIAPSSYHTRTLPNVLLSNILSFLPLKAGVASRKSFIAVSHQWLNAARGIPHPVILWTGRYIHECYEWNGEAKPSLLSTIEPLTLIIRKYPHVKHAIALINYPVDYQSATLFLSIAPALAVTLQSLSFDHGGMDLAFDNPLCSFAIESTNIRAVHFRSISESNE